MQPKQNKPTLTPDILRRELEVTLKQFGASPEIHFGFPNPQSPAWKLVAEFTHPVGMGTVSVWQSAGCCDIDFLPEGSRDGLALHGEFDDDDALLEFVKSSLVSLQIHP